VGLFSFICCMVTETDAKTAIRIFDHWMGIII